MSINNLEIQNGDIRFLQYTKLYTKMCQHVLIGIEVIVKLVFVSLTQLWSEKSRNNNSS